MQSLPVSSAFTSSEQTPEKVGAPLDLVTSEVTARSFQVSWSHAPGNVEKYRVVYYPAQGGEPQEVQYILCFLLRTQIHLLYFKSVFTELRKGSKQSLETNWEISMSLQAHSSENLMTLTVIWKLYMQYLICKHREGAFPAHQGVRKRMELGTKLLLKLFTTMKSQTKWRFPSLLSIDSLSSVSVLWTAPHIYTNPLI